MMLKREKEHDNYMLRNQCTEILNLVRESSMKKGSYNYPTSRHASISRDPYRNDDRNRDLGEVTSVHRFVLDGQDEELSVRRADIQGSIPNKASDSKSQREISKKVDNQDPSFYTHRSITVQEKNLTKMESEFDDLPGQLEKVKSQLAKKSNKISKLLTDLAQKDSIITSLRQKIFQLTERNENNISEMPSFARHIPLSIQVLDTIIVGNKKSVRDLEIGTTKIQSGNLLVIQTKHDLPKLNFNGMNSCIIGEEVRVEDEENIFRKQQERVSSELSNPPQSSERNLGPEGGYPLSPSGRSDTKVDDCGRISLSYRKKSDLELNQQSVADRDETKPTVSTLLGQSRVAHMPPIRKTTSYQCIPAGSLVSSYYGLKREDSRDTLQRESVRSTEVEKLMLENRRVTKDLRNMFEQYNSVEGFIKSEDHTPNNKSFRKTAGTTEKADVKLDQRQPQSGDKKTIQSNRKQQQLLLDDFMQHGILETRAEDLQDDSDLVGRLVSGSNNLSKVGSKASSPILGQSVHERSLQRIANLGVEKGSMKSNQSFAGNGSKFGSQNEHHRREDSSKQGSPHQFGYQSSPKCVNIDVDFAGKSDKKSNQEVQTHGNLKENTSVQNKSNQSLRSPINDGTKNVSIRVIEDNSAEKEYSERSSQEDALFGRQRRRLNGFVDTFKAADIDIEDIRSPDNEAEPDIRVPDYLDDPEDEKAVNKNFKLSKLDDNNDQDYFENMDQSGSKGGSIYSSALRHPYKERTSPATATLLRQNLALEVVEPSLSSNQQSESRVFWEDKKNCSPKYVPDSHRSLYGSNCLDPLAESLKPQAVSSRHYQDEELQDHKFRPINQPASHFRHEPFTLHQPLPQQTKDRGCLPDDGLAGGKHGGQIGNFGDKKIAGIKNRGRPVFVEEPWLQVGQHKNTLESEVQACYQVEDTGLPYCSPLQQVFKVKADKKSPLLTVGSGLENHKSPSGDQKYLTKIPHFESAYPEENFKQGTPYSPPEQHYTEKNISRRKISHEKEGRTDGQKRPLWQASGISIREIATHSGFSAEKRSPTLEPKELSPFKGHQAIDSEFVIYKREGKMTRERPLSSKTIGKDMSDVSLARSDLTMKPQGRDKRLQQKKTSYRDLMHYIRPSSKDHKMTPVERSRSRKAHSVINHHPEYLDETDTKSVRSNISGLKHGNTQMSTNEKKHMKFKTDYCGLIRHIAINLVEESGSTSNSCSPNYEELHQKAGNRGKNTRFNSPLNGKLENLKDNRQANQDTYHMRQCSTTLNMNMGANLDEPNPRLSPITNKPGYHARRNSQIVKTNNTLNSIMEPSNGLKHKNNEGPSRRNSQIQEPSKQITPSHSRRPSNVSIAHSQKSQTKKMGIGQKGKLYISKASPKETSELQQDHGSYDFDQKITLQAQARVDLYQPKVNKENQNKLKPMQKVPFSHNEYNLGIPKFDSITSHNQSNLMKASKTDNSFLGIKINDIQNLYNQDGGQSSQRNTDRSNQYVLKCRGSPLSSCKYGDLSRASENNLYGQRLVSKQDPQQGLKESNTRVFGKQILNSAQLNSSSNAVMEKAETSTTNPRKSTHKPESPARKTREKERVSYMSKLNDTVYSAHDSIVMMHEILVDKVSDLTNKLIVHERSSSKKPKFNPRVTLEAEEKFNQK
jgi:hypothetical protein